MPESIQPDFQGGGNIAMKVPSHEYDSTVAFYTEVLRLPLLEKEGNSTVLQFGANRLWLDRVDHLSQAEVWLQLTTDDAAAAADYLALYGVRRRDEIERLPEGFNGFWINNPANIIHLVDQAR